MANVERVLEDGIQQTELCEGAVSATPRSKMATVTGLRVIGLFVIFLMCNIHVTEALNPQTMLKCLPRQYTFRASKTTQVNGKVLPCWDDVTVYSCWGRCDSFEYGDYKIPYKISYHPVCTYTEQTMRRVRLRRCHPQHPDPYYEVFDASVCACALCDSDHTSCENLNG